MSLREEILKAVEEAASAPRNREPVTLAGKPLFVVELNAAERDDLEVMQMEGQRSGTALQNFRAKVLVKVLVDESDVRVFQDADAGIVGKLNAREIRKAFDIAAKLNALYPEDVKELTKNS